MRSRSQILKGSMPYASQRERRPELLGSAGSEWVRNGDPMPFHILFKIPWHCPHNPCTQRSGVCSHSLWCRGFILIGISHYISSLSSQYPVNIPVNMLSCPLRIHFKFQSNRMSIVVVVGSAIDDWFWSFDSGVRALRILRILRIYKMRNMSAPKTKRTHDLRQLILSSENFENSEKELRKLRLRFCSSLALVMLDCK